MTASFLELSISPTDKILLNLSHIQRITDAMKDPESPNPWNKSKIVMSDGYYAIWVLESYGTIQLLIQQALKEGFASL